MGERKQRLKKIASTLSLSVLGCMFLWAALLALLLYLFVRVILMQIGE